jgi:hypothetical protein
MLAVKSLVGVVPSVASLSEPTLWRSALDSIREINERCLAAFAQMAKGPGVPPLELVAQLKGAFGRLDPGAQVRAADLPFLLVDMRFGCGDQWTAWMGGDPPTPILDRAFPGFPVQTAIPLARCTLTVAAAVARHSPGLAGVHGGLTPQISAAMARLTMSRLDDIAERHHMHLRPRWEKHPSVWRQLLDAALSGDRGAMERFRLRGLQLLGSAWGSQATR